MKQKAKEWSGDGDGDEGGGDGDTSSLANGVCRRMPLLTSSSIMASVLQEACIRRSCHLSFVPSAPTFFTPGKGGGGRWETSYNDCELAPWVMV